MSPLRRPAAVRMVMERVRMTTYNEINIDRVTGVKIEGADSTAQTTKTRPFPPLSVV
jgi:hypothetical protein